MVIKFKKFHPDAVIPKKAHESDFCYDVVAVDKEEVLPGVFKYRLGFGLEFEDVTIYQKHPDFEDLHIPMRIDTNNMNLSFDIRPRSSIYKTGLVMCNSMATGDFNYRGEYALMFYHVNKDLPPYEVGDKIGQMKIGFSVPLEFTEVDNLTDSDRGEGGFGSSGK